MRISVTQFHIDNGIPGSRDQCALALAFEEADHFWHDQYLIDIAWAMDGDRRDPARWDHQFSKGIVSLESLNGNGCRVGEEHELPEQALAFIYAADHAVNEPAFEGRLPPALAELLKPFTFEIHGLSDPEPALWRNPMRLAIT